MNKTSKEVRVEGRMRSKGGTYLAVFNLIPTYKMAQRDKIGSLQKLESREFDLSRHRGVSVSI